MSRADTESQISSDAIQQVEEPPLYRVILLNDDYTTMDFVVEILTYVFNKTLESATRIMLQVHRNGMGVCGLYPLDVAETKVETVHALAKENGFPLKCLMEKQ
jgi:ATP-dependent Clp protease adaptor protein ClpS